MTIQKSVKVSINGIFPAVSALLLFLAAYYPALKILVGKWAHSAEYNHAFFIVPIIGYIIWSKRDEIKRLPIQLSNLGLLLLLGSSLLYFFSLLTQVQTIIALSFYLTIIGSLIFLFGVRIISLLFTPLLLLLLLIPVPDQVYTRLTFPLQLEVSKISEMILRAMNVSILREGNIMSIPGKSFEVVEACSGLRSIIALSTLSILIGYFMLRQTTSRLILLVASIPTAILVNICRVTVMILLYHFFQIDLGEGIRHTSLGIIIFGAALGLLLLTERILEYWENRK